MAWGPKASYGLQVYVDAYNYYPGAGTVDFKAQKTSGPLIYYKAEVVQVGDGTAKIGMRLNGSFQNASPLKSFSCKEILANRISTATRDFRIRFTYYAYANYTGYIDEVESHTFTIHGTH